MRIRGAALAALFAGGALAASAEDAVLVVTAAKTAQDVEDTVEAVEVVTEEQIERMGAKNLKEIVENISGIVIYDHPLSTVMMQGFEGAYVKVLVDGIEITGDVSGATPVAQLPASDVERVEIVRGASSVLYGSDAMGGVINIITKKPEAGRFSGKVQQEIGSNLRYYGEASAAYASKSFALSAGGSFDYDEGKTATEEDNLGQDVSIFEVPYSRLGSARASASWLFESGELTVYGNWADSLRETSTSVDGGAAFDDLKLEGGLKGSKALGDALSLDGFVSWKRYDHYVDELNYTFDTSERDASLFEDAEGELRLAWDPSISHSVLFGFNGKYETLDGDAFEEKKASAMLSLFAQDTWNLGGADRLRLVPGLRFDYRPPQSGDEDHLFKLSPKLSARFDPRDDLVLRFSYGMGFKTPSLKQNYWVFFHPAPANFLLIGNPDLKPETSHGFNASAAYKPTAALSFEAGAYFNYIYDLIDTVIVDENDGYYDGTYYIYRRAYRNVDEAITAGGDLSVRYNGERLKTTLSYALTVAKEKSDDDYIDLASRVPHQVKGNLVYMIPVLETEAALQASWNAPELIDYDAQTYSPDYFMVGARLSKRVMADKLELYAGLRNALDNLHFIESTEGASQQEYFGLNDGTVFYMGGIYKW